MLFRSESEYHSGDPFDGSMVFLDDVVAVSASTHQDIGEGIGLDTFNGCCVGATLVESDLLWHIVPVDGPFQKSPGSSQTLLGSHQEVHRSKYKLLEKSL